MIDSVWKIENFSIKTARVGLMEGLLASTLHSLLNLQNPAKRNLSTYKMQDISIRHLSEWIDCLTRADRNRRPGLTNGSTTNSVTGSTDPLSKALRRRSRELSRSIDTQISPRVLEFGSRDGIVCRRLGALLDRNAFVIGLDPQPDSVYISRELTGGLIIPASVFFFIRTEEDLQTLVEWHSYFDLILSNTGPIEDGYAFGIGAKKLLAPGGTLIVLWIEPIFQGTQITTGHVVEGLETAGFQVTTEDAYYTQTFETTIELETFLVRLCVEGPLIRKHIRGLTDREKENFVTKMVRDYLDENPLLEEKKTVCIAYTIIRATL